MSGEEKLMKYLKGELRSSPTGAKRDTTIVNRLGISIRLQRIDDRGRLQSADVIKAGDSQRIREAGVGDVYLMTAPSGAYVRVWTVNADDTGTTVEGSDLVQPNFIGAAPSFAAGMSAPLESSSPVLVGIGDFGNDKVLTREQFWILNRDESVTVAPGEKLSRTITVREGVQQSSTMINTVAAEIGTNASAGWGPISVQISGKLSQSSSQQQSVALTNETTRSTSIEFDNSTSSTVRSFIIYQLRDRFTFWKNADKSQPDVRSTFISDNAVGQSVAGQ